MEIHDTVYSFNYWGIFFITFTSSTIHDYSQNPVMVHENVGSEDSGYI